MRRIATIFFSFLVGLVFTLTSPQTTFASQSSLTSGCVSLTANPRVGSAPLAVNFLGQGFDQGHSINQYEFDFGDASGGQTRIFRQESSEALHRYYNPGTYTASLKVKTAGREWLGGGDCKRMIIVTNLATSTRGGVSTLPKTGVGSYLGGLCLALVFGGLYLRKRFKLS